jgi:hypothetical protein
MHIAIAVNAKVQSNTRIERAASRDSDSSGVIRFPRIIGVGLVRRTTEPIGLPAGDGGGHPSATPAAAKTIPYRNGVGL